MFTKSPSSASFGAKATECSNRCSLPNFFLVYGPNTNLGHNSILFMFECQFDYVLECLAEMRRRGARSMEVRREAMTRFNRRLQSDLDESVWAGACTNW